MCYVCLDGLALHADAGDRLVIAIACTAVTLRTTRIYHDAITDTPMALSRCESVQYRILAEHPPSMTFTAPKCLQNHADAAPGNFPGVRVRCEGCHGAAGMVRAL